MPMAPCSEAASGVRSVTAAERLWPERWRECCAPRYDLQMRSLTLHTGVAEYGDEKGICKSKCWQFVASRTVLFGLCMCSGLQQS